MKLELPLQTERLALRTLDPGALSEQYLTWVNDPELTRFLEIRFRTHSRADLSEFVSTMNQSIDNLLLGLFVKADGRHIGNIKLGPVSAPHERADIGLLIGDRSVWGKGYATEAIRAVTSYGLGALGLHRITAGMYEENVGSYKAFIKAGYSVDGRLKSYWRLDGRWQDEIILHRLAERADG